MCIICDGKPIKNLKELVLCENVVTLPELPQSLTHFYCMNCHLTTPRVATVT